MADQMIEALPKSERAVVSEILDHFQQSREVDFDRRSTDATEAKIVLDAAHDLIADLAGGGLQTAMAVAGDVHRLENPFNGARCR